MARAGVLVAMVADEAAVTQQVVQLLAEELRRTGLPSAAVRFVAASQWTPAGAEGGLAVAIGAQAFRKLVASPPPRPWLALLVSRSGYEDVARQAGPRATRDAVVLLLDQPMSRQFDLIRLALPHLASLGVVLGAGGFALPVDAVRVAEDRGVRLLVERAMSSNEIVPAIERIAETNSSGILALPDPLVQNRNTVQPFLLATYRVGLPVIAYSEAYLQAGATLSLYSSPAQIARQAAELVHAAVQGRPLPATVSPKYFTVAVNSRVARSLGIILPPAARLQEKLEEIAD